MTATLEDILLGDGNPPEPIPTAAEPRLTSLEGVRAVLFDVYGTLLVSGSGDVGLTAQQPRGDAAEAAFADEGLTPPGDLEGFVAELDRTIAKHHERAHREGVAFPEVEIREVWADALAAVFGDQAPSEPDQIERLACRYESRINPVGQMPGAAACLTDLSGRGLVLGIISNAQFFTPRLLPLFLGKPAADLGFDSALRYYSFEHRLAKPGEDLYRMAASGLADRGIEPRQTVFVGNDMRNDIWPAAAVGFRTVLFAGDARSLRLREDHSERSRRPEADAVITALQQLTGIV